MILLAILGFLAFTDQSAEKQSAPLVSPTNPFYLSCTYWNGKGWTDPTSRSAKTPILESKTGFRSYGEVKVAVNQGDCQNTTTLFVALGRDAEFKQVYTKEGGGNGIRLIGWSPNGRFLLVETNEWIYESDSGFSSEPAVFDATKNGLHRLPDFDKALTDHFGTQCEFEHAIMRWQTDSQVVVKVSKTPFDESYEQHFCIKSPIFLLFDLDKRTISQLSRPIRK